MPRKDGDTASRFEIGRRDFLVLGSVAALGVAATGYGSELGRTIGLTGFTRPFTVGFADVIATKESADVHRLIAAEHVAADRDFHNEVVRVTVHGFWSGDEAPRSAAVAAYYAHDGNDLPFLAWGHVHRAGMAAPQASFRVPVREGSLVLGFESRQPMTVPQNELTRRLADLRTHAAHSRADALIAAANDETASPRCTLPARRGTYVVAFDAKPNWNALKIAGGAKPLGNTSFDYLMLTIDRA